MAWALIQTTDHHSQPTLTGLLDLANSDDLIDLFTDEPSSWPLTKFSTLVTSGTNSVTTFLNRFFISWEIKYLKPPKYLAR